MPTAPLSPHQFDFLVSLLTGPRAVSADPIERMTVGALLRRGLAWACNERGTRVRTARARHVCITPVGRRRLLQEQRRAVMRAARAF